MKTELVWEGKYDEFGNRREVDVAACAMPMQKIETVDEPRQRAAAEGQTDMFERKLIKVREDCPSWPDFRNRLIWGDNKLVMASLLKDFKGKVDLIYIDPPFDVGADFTMQVEIGEGKQKANKGQSTLEMVAYRDTWGRGSESYLQLMCDRLSVLHELLTPSGALYLHCDWHMGHSLKLLADDILGRDLFCSEIVWKRTTGHSDARSYGSVHDTILVYFKPEHKMNEVLQNYDPEYVDTYYRYKDHDGRRFMSADLTGAGSGPARDFGDKGSILPPDGRHWMYDQAGIDKVLQENRIYWTKNGVPRLKKFLDKSPGMPASDLWVDIQALRSWHKEEDTSYSTQKPEALLERIIKASSNEGDLVADFFCGSGTTGAVAERLGRRWIMADLGRFAIHTSRKRMIDVQRQLHDTNKPYRAFDVYNLGRYERQWWQKERLQGADDEHRRVVLEFFKAEMLDSAPSPLIHGRKASAFCHVDGIDSIFTRGEATAVAKAVAQAGGKECYCLAWEFEMDIRLHTEAIRQELGVKLKLIQIPREIMEKNRTSPPPFLEMAVLEAEPVYRTEGKKRMVDIKLTKFMPSLAEVPSKELEALKERAVKSGFDFIDFWAVDFDWEPGKPFNHHWQDYRTRKDRSLKTVSDAGFEYPKKGKYQVCVKVVDTFGCDTSVTVEVKV